MSLHLNLSTGKFLNSSTLFKLSDALLLDVSSGEIVMSNLLVPRAAGVTPPPALLATLDLNFASSLSLDDAISGNNLVTFSRASSGTYVGSDGLIKNSTVNLVTDSASANNWGVLGGGATTASTSVCPDGSTNATRVTGSVLNDGAAKNFTAAVSGIHTASYYARTRTGIATIVKAAISGATGLSVTLPADGSWVRVVGVPSNIGAGSKYLAVRSASAAIDIDVWGLQAELGSTATDYVPTSGTIGGAPRFDHDPVTLQSLGLLIEKAQTNLLPYSEEFDQGAWATSTVAVTPNNAVAPDGTTTADTLTATSNNADIYDSVPTSNVTHINSIWIKRRTGTGQIRLRNPQGQSELDITSQVTNEWKRISSSATLPFSGGTLAFAGVKIAVSGDAVDVWGIQTEIGSFSTSYIPTSGSAVTRAADVATIALGVDSWYNQSEGAMLMTFNVLDNSLLNQQFLGAGSATASSNTGYNYRVSTLYAVQASGASNWSSTANWLTTGILPGDNKFAFGYGPGSNATVRDGVIKETNTDTVLVEQSSATLYILKQLSGHISRITYYDTRLPDEELVTLTS